MTVIDWREAEANSAIPRHCGRIAAHRAINVALCMWPEQMGRLFIHRLGWRLVVVLLVAFSAATASWAVSLSAARHRPADGLRSSMSRARDRSTDAATLQRAINSSPVGRPSSSRVAPACSRLASHCSLTGPIPGRTPPERCSSRTAAPATYWRRPHMSTIQRRPVIRSASAILRWPATAPAARTGSSCSTGRPTWRMWTSATAADPESLTLIQMRAAARLRTPV